MASAAQKSQPFGPSDRLYAAIGDFLADHRLSVDPVNYAFAHRVLSQPKGPLAVSVARLTDGGVRLTSRDIEDMGGPVIAPGATVERSEEADDTPAESPNATMQALVARTQMQVEDFADTVAGLRAETQVFGRDLLAGADAIRSASGEAVEDITRLATTMLDRVQAAEARLAAATVEAEALRVELEAARDDARRDPLTGLANRRAFEDAFAEESAAGTSICVALCDIDHFKSVNDRFGHAVGDRVLKVIAQALREACGDHLVARYGGEEFAILFTGVPIEDAVTTLDSARGAVAAKRYRLRETDAPLGAVTFSGGVSAYVDRDVMGSVMGRADRLLYAAKADGRNMIKADGEKSQQSARDTPEKS
ncbi:GGDEF domain-containing protein [Sphingomonas sp.]|uniref:GGDEF domain-containing protein n=1 Tax=Sphingomonas sp. TaxID=28214 RepID=UPI0025E13543|nr:GGDEF domain-containing protein [Sphingomonas sp.]